MLQTVVAMVTLPGDLQNHLWVGEWEPILENVFLGVYTVEAILRIYALGCFPEEHTYLRNRWNVVDFGLLVICYAYLVFIMLGVPDGTNPALFRVVRCLRPLRAAGFLQGVKSALGYAPFLLNIMLLLIIWITLFAVLGTQMYGGALTFICAKDYVQMGGELTEPLAGWMNETASSGSWSTLPAEVFATDHLGHPLAGPKTPVDCPIMVQCPNELLVDRDKAEQCIYFEDSADFGFDNFPQAMMTGWIVTTGDYWFQEIITDLRLSSSRYTHVAWYFVIGMAFCLNLVISNLFAAVIVQSFFEDGVEAQLQEDEEASLKERKAKVIFNRIDHNHSGHIEVEELHTITELLGLEDCGFMDWEEEEAMKQMDVNNDGEVDFVEFVHFWDSNTREGITCSIYTFFHRVICAKPLALNYCCRCR